MSGLVNGSQGIVKKIWYSGDPDPRLPQPALPSVVFVEWDGYKGKCCLFKSEILSEN